MKTKGLLLGFILMAALLLTACGKTPAPTTTTTAVVKSVVFAKGLDSSFQPVDPTTTFLPTDTVRVSVGFNSNPTSGVLAFKWYLDNQLVHEVTLDIAKAAAGDVVVFNGNSYTGATLFSSEGMPVSTNYRLDLYIDNVKIDEYPFSVAE